jgi:hypothetical protein
MEVELCLPKYCSRRVAAWVECGTGWESFFGKGGVAVFVMGAVEFCFTGGSGSGLGVIPALMERVLCFGDVGGGGSDFLTVTGDGASTGISLLRFASLPFGERNPAFSIAVSSSFCVGSLMGSFAGVVISRRRPRPAAPANILAPSLTETTDSVSTSDLGGSELCSCLDEAIGMGLRDSNGEAGLEVGGLLGEALVGISTVSLRLGDFGNVAGLGFVMSVGFWSAMDCCG